METAFKFQIGQYVWTRGYDGEKDKFEIIGRTHINGWPVYQLNGITRLVPEAFIW